MIPGKGFYVNDSNASCMDGTPPVYWITYGSGSGANKWLLSFEEGGFCNLLNGGYDNCYTFAYEKKGGYPGTTSGYFGTSNISKVPTNFDFNSIYGNYFSRNNTVNPLMYNWNMVYMHYCDGSLWLGNITDYVISQGTKMFIRGRANVQAIINDLMNNQNFNNAQSIVVAGQSVGGVAAYNYVDYIASMFTGSTRVVGMPDSGFFLPKNYAPCDYLTQMEYIYYNFSTKYSLQQSCIAEERGAPWLCQTAQYMIPYIKTPIYALQSRYDSSNYDYILCDNTNQSAVYEFSNLLAAAFEGTGITDPDNVNGAFLDNCPHHYYVYNLSVPEPQVFQPWTDLVSTDGYSQSQAFLGWYNGDSKATNLNQTPVPHEIDFAYCSLDWLPTNEPSNQNSSDSLSGSSITAIAISAAVVFIGVLGVINLIVRSRQRTKREESATTENPLSIQLK